MSKNGEKKKRSKKKIAAIVFLVILALALAAAGGIYYIGHRYYMKTNYLSDEEATRQIEEYKASQEEEDGEEDDGEEDDGEEEEETDPDLLEAQEMMELYASDDPITTDGDVYNIVLAGLDTTTDSWVGNTDSMILISINYRLHQISMISLMRDTYVYIPGVGNRKLNAAYPNGGGPLMLQTIEENYKIDVNRYVTVNFESMISIVDEIGEIEITFTEKEAENANKSIKQQCRILGLKSKDYLIPGEGTYMCNGMQAVAYARIRKVGNSDYQRTERQREVIMKLLENVKKMDLDDIDRVATHILPLLTHNVPESEYWNFLAKVTTLLNFNIVQDRIPYDGLYQSINGNLVPYWDQTVQRLKETIYGEDAVDDTGNVLTVTQEDGTDETVETDETEETAEDGADAQDPAEEETDGGTEEDDAGAPTITIIGGDETDGDETDADETDADGADADADETDTDGLVTGSSLVWNEETQTWEAEEEEETQAAALEDESGDDDQTVRSASGGEIPRMIYPYLSANPGEFEMVSAKDAENTHFYKSRSDWKKTRAESIYSVEDEE